MKKLFICLMFMTITFTCFGQKMETIVKATDNIKSDTSRIVDLSDKLAIYFNISGKVNNIDIQSSTSNQQLSLVPNGNTTVGFGLDYKWIGIGSSISLPFMNKDDEIYGESERFDMQINYYNNSFGIDTYIKYYKGFYLENPNEFTDWPNVKFPLLPEMETFATGISGYYMFNHRKFSYKAAFSRTMWQKKSSGSWILGSYLSWNACVSPNGVVPKELPDSLKAEYDLNGFSNFFAGITFGYTYTWVIKKRFFLNLSIVPGIGYSRPNILTSNGDEYFKPSISASITSRLSTGYEGKYFYYGFNMFNLIDNFHYEKFEISTNTGNLRFFVGRRFDVSKLFKHKRTEEI